MKNDRFCLNLFVFVFILKMKSMQYYVLIMFETVETGFKPCSQQAWDQRYTIELDRVIIEIYF